MRPSPAIRRLLPVLTIGALVFAACGSDDSSSDSTDAPAETEAAAATDAPAGTDAPAATEAAAPDESCAATIDDGVLTVATGNPAFYPYVLDDTPESGEGFESAVAYAVAAQMGYDADSVVWVRTGFDEAIQPGAKSFDMNLQQFSIDDDRKKSIDMSLPYYTSNQAIVALDGSPAEGATSTDDLKDVKFGAQVGTTSLAFITDVIQPNQDPFVYDDNVAAKAALEANQIDAAVFDLPTALFVSGVEIEGSSVTGQFPADAGGTTDDFGFVLEKDAALTSCVDAAITALVNSGDLDAITTEWMSDFTGAPVISVD
ncbi:MAG: amino acid ABC transporter substrate-binding protein [Actinobacteria bacterium]|nr:amino acid ABC transporter substrate-binding protein [Actinomycetota bacterium]